MTINSGAPFGSTDVEVVESSVPVLSGSVSVRSTFVFGEAMVSVPVPEALPVSAILLMVYSTTYLAPEDTVTVTPELMLTGPVDIAFFVAGIV